MRIDFPTREELLAVPRRRWDEPLENVVSVYVLPSRRKHDSGYACMDFVAEKLDGTMVGFGGCCDSVRLDGPSFKFDCLPGSKIIRIFNGRKPNTMRITDDLSSIDFIQDGELGH